ncbi:MAG TPA: hypothetical protein PLX90_02860, partial [Anaerolineales bacterium]|nr:hypothetical protein [Anaerolineales bacterium]
IPFWWFRGYSSMYIERFEKINSTHILLDIFEMKIDYIVAVRKFNVEERNFVYVQLSPSAPTGLYNYDSGWLENYLQEQLKKNYGYYVDEEYAIWDNHLITRAEYDDGSAIINGKPVKTMGAELRARYITPYNFILCGQNHVINSFDNLDIEMNSLMNGILLGTITIDDLVNFIERLPNTSRYRANY